MAKTKFSRLGSRRYSPGAGTSAARAGATAAYDPKEDLRYVWSFEIQIIGSNSFYDDNLQALMGLIEQGKLKPVIDKHGAAIAATVAELQAELAKARK